MSERPYTLVAELTYRCPLGCLYCSNPLVMPRAELDTAAWIDVLRQAEALGVVQVCFTGGEPLLRDDLEVLIAEARSLELYGNLITSGVPLAPGRMERLAAAGLDAVQLSLQDLEPEPAARIAGGDFAAEKAEALAELRALGLPLTLNVVLHRENIGRTGAFLALAEAAGASRIELANTQYLGWALENRDGLLPRREQLLAAKAEAEAARARLAGRMEVLFVLPDYHAGRPRACMGGWARRFLVVAPDGLLLPCHGARDLPGLTFPTVAATPLADAWLSAEAFAAYRGEGWMRDPCLSCPERGRDFGGCRCQAFRLTGDPRAADPACSLSPHHALVHEAQRRAELVEPASTKHRRLRTVP